ncbi:thioredoxin family protein [Pseudogracilibacillus sp. SO30301A]|uniref:thioredoxin family protein n=1 Tax=Pseudogracilibacillus sp. SO30301A TaxID=3098291 RepID=UPI003FA79E31
MQEITAEQLEQKSDYLLYIHTPFCGTCHVARSFLEKIEKTHQQDIFYEMNASLYPEFMQKYKVESVPCLFVMKDDQVKEKVYTFFSVANIYHYVWTYVPELFRQN